MTVAKENLCALGKDCPSAILPTINPTWTALALNPGPCSDKPWTNCLRYGMADL
jgi:hypothetical protein